MLTCLRPSSPVIDLELFEPLAASARAIKLARRGQLIPLEEGEIGDLTRDAVVTGLGAWVASRKGWLYLAANASLPGLLKVGCTRKSVDRRMAELSGAGMPTPWAAVQSWPIYDAHGLEALCHAACRQWRYRKELFTAPAAVLTEAIEATVQADRALLEHTLACLFLPGQVSEILSPATS